MTDAFGNKGLRGAFDADLPPRAPAAADADTTKRKTSPGTPASGDDATTIMADSQRRVDDNIKEDKRRPAVNFGPAPPADPLAAHTRVANDKTMPDQFLSGHKTSASATEDVYEFIANWQRKLAEVFDPAEWPQLFTDPRAAGARVANDKTMPDQFSSGHKTSASAIEEDVIEEDVYEFIASRRRKIIMAFETLPRSTLAKIFDPELWPELFNDPPAADARVAKDKMMPGQLSSSHNAPASAITGHGAELSNNDTAGNHRGGDCASARLCDNMGKERKRRSTI